METETQWGKASEIQRILGISLKPNLPEHQPTSLLRVDVLSSSINLKSLGLRWAYSCDNNNLRPNQTL